MLAQKEMPKKKLIIYICIIAFMLLGTAFMLFLNNRQTRPSLITGEDPTMPNAIVPITENAIAGDSLPAAALTQTPAAAAPAEQIGTGKNSAGFDLTIFTSEKFKRLKASQPVSQTAAEVGKRDPFKPN